MRERRNIAPQPLASGILFGQTLPFRQVAPPVIVYQPRNIRIPSKSTTSLSLSYYHTIEQKKPIVNQLFYINSATSFFSHVQGVFCEAVATVV